MLTQSMILSRGCYSNTGNGPTLQTLDIGHKDYVGVVDPDAAFWALVRKDQLGAALTDGVLLRAYRKRRDAFLREMDTLRFKLKPLAVYFNPTERCNLNCTYCYLPEGLRRKGQHMSSERIVEALAILRAYFKKTLPSDVRPQIIFHGSEPLLVREAVFAAIRRYGDYFRFGVQTNGTLLDEAAINFLTEHQIGIGLSLDGHAAAVADRTRRTWSGAGTFKRVLSALKSLRGYHNYNVICTVTSANLRSLSELVNFLHAQQVPTCMLNAVRCTLPPARKIKPPDHELACYYLQALDRTFQLYQKSGRKLVVANFANILLSILAPSARRLMCDISPCGGGRCFFALSARGDLFPCSEFIGLPEFKGGNLFAGELSAALKSPAFLRVTSRKVEEITPCRACAIRHFCGAPCPAEAFALNDGMQERGAFCELYEEQVRYALRLIADGKAESFLWDDWAKDTKVALDIKQL